MALPRLLVVVVVLVSLSLCRSHVMFEKDFGDVDEQLSQFKDTTGKKWVLLIAGSRYYYNYRHQADVCHAYQVVHKHGIPDEQIVVMMYDDIANAEQNPHKGELINHPDGPNVYTGVPKDYTDKDVTPENFISVLTGKKDMMKGIGSGKVIESGPDDHVFVFFSDHGAPGLIAFPSSRLYKDDLANAIKYLHTNNRYQQLVFYIEACESGSMFYNLLPTDINVYATTAANRTQSSYACYYDTKRQAYLGDRYSVSWLEDSDMENLSTESLKTQYMIVKGKTNQSEVVQFGDLSLNKEPVSFFQGSKQTPRERKPLRNIVDDIPAPDVKLYTLFNRIQSAKTTETKNALRKELNDEYKLRNDLTNVFQNLATFATGGDNAQASKILNSKPELNEMSCYRTAVEWFDRVCYDLDNTDFAYRQIYVLGNLCDAGISTQDLLSAISKMCARQ